MSWRDKIAKAILGGKTGGPTPGGIHVYHSSPHDFDRFDLSKIGTGEGAQSYGHGIYLAENPKVSGQGGQYWNSFLQRFENTPEGYAAEALQASKFDRAAALEASQRNIDKLAGWVDQYRGATMQPAASNWRVYENELKQARDQHDLLTKGPVGPRTYEVNFKTKPEELLDYDRPISQQSPLIQSVFDSFGYKPRDAPPFMLNDAANQLAAKEGSWATAAGGRNVSEKLREAGVPGIRYLDEGSRQPAQLKTRLDTLRTDLANAEMKGVGQPDVMRRQIESLQNQLSSVPPLTHNYVAFDPSKLDIMAKYGVVGGVPLGAATLGGTIDPSTYGVQQ
jgi:hypothetical protein